MKVKVKRQKATSAIFLFVLVVCSAVNSLAQNPDDLAERIRRGSTEEKRNILFQIRNLQTAEASRVAIPALQDKDEIVRATAVYAVIFLPADEAVQVLLPLLKDKSPFVRKETANALGKVRNPQAVRPLLETIQSDKDLEVKAASVAALGEIGHITVVESLFKILQEAPREEEDFLRRAAARSIGQIAQIQQIRTNYVVTPESPLPEKYDLSVNLKYLNLAEIFSGFRHSVSVLLNVLQNPKESDDVKREAAFALGTIGDPRSAEVLRQQLNAKDYYLAEICRESLLKLQTVADSYR